MRQQCCNIMPFGRENNIFINIERYESEIICEPGGQRSDNFYHKSNPNLMKSFKAKQMKESNGLPDYLVKVPLIGATKCGKTNLLNRLCYDDYLGTPDETIGIDFYEKTITRANSNIKIQFWDSNFPPQRKDQIRNLCLKGSIAIVIVYSITDALSFEEAEKQLRILQKNEQIDRSTPIYLIGTKSELREYQKVDTQRAKNLSEQNNATFLEVSAKDRSGINELISKLGSGISDSILGHQKKKDKGMVNKFYNMLQD